MLDVQKKVEGGTKDESAKREQDAGRVARLVAVLGEASSAHRADVRSINGRSNRRNAGYYSRHGDTL